MERYFLKTSWVSSRLPPLSALRPTVACRSAFAAQLLTFEVADNSTIEIFTIHSSKSKFAGLKLNGTSIDGNFAVNGTSSLPATGYPTADRVSLRLLADYTCNDCRGDRLGGYVRVTKAVIPAPAIHLDTPVSLIGAVPESATWAMMILGLGLAAACTRRRAARTVIGILLAH
jgi:hypothetical protein